VNGWFWLALAALAVLAVSLVVDDVFDVLPDDLGPDWLSLPVLAAVVAAFGLAAGAVEAAGAGSVPVLGAGAVAGAGAGVLTARLVRLAMHLPTDPPVRHADLQGRIGRVVTAVAPPRSGEVLVPLGGTSHKLRASSDQPLPVGTEIVVVDVISPTSVVVAPLGIAPGEQGELRP